ncbi:MAG TPA: matrixin family metalloprotease, partial [Planctomycetes bacterium]|nr:matrixin family metalloprotease [Planctomycetota bacterium]
MKLWKALPVAALIAATVGLLQAHTPLIGNGKSLKWANPGNISLVIQSAGSDDIPDGSHVTALRMAMDGWNNLTGTANQFIEDTSPTQQARTDWSSSSVHLLYFDETNSSGYFPTGSGTVAITPVSFMSTGKIVDADVLFNGSGFSFTTSGEVGAFDVADVASHELGHLLGLDHSGWAGATMYPYVDSTVILHRSLSEDELRGMRHLYPTTNTGSISGTIKRASDGSFVFGAHVVARNAQSGRTAGSILTGSKGAFTIRGLDPGTYEVYVVPLGNGSFGDAPVDASNISGYTIQTDFEAAVYPTTATITTTEAVGMGTLLVGADVSFNLGTNIDRFPLRAVAGKSQTLVVRGNGLLSSSTLEASDPDLIIGTPMWFGSSVSFQLTVPPGELPGHVDLIATSPTGEVSILPAGIEITPPTPTVTDVIPSTGAAAGGTPVTVKGTDFMPGSRVVIGNQIYIDGVGGTSVVDPQTITLTTQAMVTGLHDLVVVDASGVEGRRPGAFNSVSLPVISTVFPTAGSTAGGTTVTLTGADFLSGTVVRINGVDQGAVTLEGTTKLTFTTTSGTAGVQVLEVESPGGGISSTAFTYETQADPTVAAISPSSTALGGGELLTVQGTGFTSDTEVLFGVDPSTGQGGLAAPSVTFIDSTTL